MAQVSITHDSIIYSIDNQEIEKADYLMREAAFEAIAAQIKKICNKTNRKIWGVVSNNQKLIYKISPTFTEQEMEFLRSIYR